MPFFRDKLYLDSFTKHCIGTEIKFTLIPKKCYLTNKWIWLKKCYRQTAMWTGPGDIIFEYRYYDKDEFLIQKIKGSI
jgi:hypothetical protein